MSAGRNTSLLSLCYYRCTFSSFFGYSLLFSALIDRSRGHIDSFFEVHHSRCVINKPNVICVYIVKTQLYLLIV